LFIHPELVNILDTKIVKFRYGVDAKKYYAKKAKYVIVLRTHHHSPEREGGSIGFERKSTITKS
jgi:hypothetical protein